MKISKRLAGFAAALVFTAVTFCGCKVEFPDSAASVVSGAVGESTVSISQAADAGVSAAQAVSGDSSSDSGTANEAPSSSAEASGAAMLESVPDASLAQGDAAPVQGTDEQGQEQGTPAQEASSAAEENPVQPQGNYCTFSIRCDTVLNHLDWLTPANLRDSIPNDGVIYPEKTVSFTPGETVYDITLRITREVGIRFEHDSSKYVQGFNNLREKSCGAASGWIYGINGRAVNMGSSIPQIKSGDRIQWQYTCAMGRDLSWEG